MTHRSFDNPHSIEARQHLLDNRCEHAPKRHRTAKRKSRAMAAKQAAGKGRAVINLAKRRRKLAALRAYWAGDREDMDNHG